MKLKDILKQLENLSEDTEIFVGYSDDNELEFELFTEEEVIDRANERAVDFGCDEEFTDLNDALQYLAEMDEDYHFMQ